MEFAFLVDLAIVGTRSLKLLRVSMEIPVGLST